MKSLVSCVVAAFCVFASWSAFAQADPTAVGPFTVLTAEYDRGDAAFSCPPSEGCEVPDAEVRAEVYYPSNLSAGPFPLVIFLHGRHSACYDPVTGTSSSAVWDQGCDPPFLSLPSYRGYDYIGRVLASHGYIVASISANGINAQDAGTAGLGIPDRAHLVEAHLDIWNQFNTTGSGVDPAPFASSFIGRVDLTNVGTMGHSRGGDGVAKHFAIFSPSSPYQVNAVLPMAPTNFSGDLVPEVDLGVILPYCDGDVYTLEGSLFYDRSRYLVPGDESTKHTLLSLGANHNFFNTTWTPTCWTDPGSCWPDDRGTIPTPGTQDDALFAYGGDTFCDPAEPTTGRLTPAEQRTVGLAYVAAFFRIYLGGETELLPFLRADIAPLPSIDPSDLHAGYHPPASRRVDLNRFHEAFELMETTLTGTGGVRGAVIANGLETFLRCGFDQANPCFPGAFREVHLSNFVGLDPTLSRVLNQWNAPSDSLVNELPPGSRDLRQFDVLQFRVGVDYRDPSNPVASPVEFTVVLNDGMASSSVSTNAQLGSNDLFFPPGRDFFFSPRTTVMNTLRLPLNLFSGVDRSNVQSVTLQYDGTPAGTILLSDMSFVNDEEGQAEPPRCQASERFIVGRAARVTNPGAEPALASSGAALTRIDSQAFVEGALSVGAVQVGSATVDGDIRSSGAITLASGATVTGAVVPFTSVTLPALPALPAFPPPSGGSVFVNPGAPVTLAPGSFSSVFVNSGGVLRLADGDYFFVNLTVNSSARVEVSPSTRVFVQASLAYRSAFVTPGGVLQPVFLGYAGGADLRMEAPFHGTLLAPAAHVFFGTGAGLTFRGTFLGRILEVNPGSALECIEGPPSSGPVSPPSGNVTATLDTFTDWGSGYCATLRVTNGSTVSTTTWSVTLNTNQSTLYTSWNGVFSGTTGTITASPIASWNAVISPGSTNDSVGFCANRTTPGVGTPFVTSAAGTF